MKIGDKVRLSTTHSNGAIINYTATVRKFSQSPVGLAVWVEIPQRVRDLPFPPYDGKRYAQFTVSQMESYVVSTTESPVT